MVFTLEGDQDIRISPSALHHGRRGLYHGVLL